MITDEMIEKGREAREEHYLRVSPVSCTCGWRSDTYIEADGLPRFEAHLVELALEAAAPLIAAQALRDLADEWREAYSADIFPCGADDLRHINATSGPNSTAKVAAYFARHWADVLSARADEAEQGGQP